MVNTMLTPMLGKRHSIRSICVGVGKSDGRRKADSSLHAVTTVPEVVQSPVIVRWASFRIHTRDRNTLWRVQNNYTIFMKLHNIQERKTNENGVSNEDVVDERRQSSKVSSGILTFGAIMK